MNLLLFRDGYPPAILRLEDRLAHYAALDAAHSGGVQPFVILVAAAVEWALDIVLEA